MLTVEPSVFLFNQSAAQPLNSIVNQGTLQVNPGNSLLLVGGSGRKLALMLYAYSQVLVRQDESRLLYLAIPQTVFLDFFSEELPQLMVELNNLKLLIFDPDTEDVVQWKS